MKQSNSHSFIKTLNESQHDKSFCEFNKENQSSLKNIDRNKSSLSVDDLTRNKSCVSIDLDRNHSSASRSPKKFNDQIININAMQIELD